MDRMVNLFKKTQKLVFTSQREYTFVYFLTNGPYTFTINGNMGDFFKGLRERIAEIGFSETCFSPDPDVSSTGLVHRIFTMHT
ncbi:MAG: hypothetical protein MRY21_03340 [Simkaniaceae bacterium]|nr:hypothetical protein [Simkaniaceae bacterium]